MNARLSIVIVTYNSAALLGRCLDSLAAQTRTDFEVLVVDNASADAARLPPIVAGRERVTLILNPDNKGFAGGQNQGMRLSRAPFLMSLNADIYLLPAFVDLALGALERYPRVGTLSGKMLRMRPDGAWTQRIDNAGLLFNRRRMPRHRGGGEQDRGQYQTPELVFGAMGAAAVYRRAMLDDVALGGSDGQYFDERFFTWYEDIDLDWRARRRGWDCLYLPEAVAYHVGDPQGHQPTPFGARYTIRNRWQMILANEPSRCIIRDAGWLLYEEWALFRHVASHGLLGAYARALRELIGLLPAVLRKRRAVQRRAQRTCLPDYPIPVEGNPT